MTHTGGMVSTGVTKLQGIWQVNENYQKILYLDYKINCLFRLYHALIWLLLRNTALLYVSNVVN